MFQKAKNETVFLATHAPPFGVLDESKGRRIGSTALRKIIEEHQPLVNFCGHVHETEGTEKIGKTLVVKVASLMFGKAVLFETSTLKLVFKTFKKKLA
ncbi:MAG: hypothetical protein M1594_01315 [Candidatus Marsarchaeota archaeon]|nr:hypothetical protein [Candidatus Marsarchaeota archaeon]